MCAWDPHKVDHCYLRVLKNLTDLNPFLFCSSCALYSLSGKLSPISGPKLIQIRGVYDTNNVVVLKQHAYLFYCFRNAGLQGRVH